MATTRQEIQPGEEDLVNREYSEEGLQDVIAEAVKSFVHTLDYHDRLLVVPSPGLWPGRTPEEAERLHNEMARETSQLVRTMAVLDKIVPLNGGLYWFDAISSEAMALRADRDEQTIQTD